MTTKEKKYLTELSKLLPQLKYCELVEVKMLPADEYRSLLEETGFVKEIREIEDGKEYPVNVYGNETVVTRTMHKAELFQTFKELGYHGVKQYKDKAYKVASAFRDRYPDFYEKEEKRMEKAKAKFDLKNN